MDKEVVHGHNEILAVENNETLLSEAPQMSWEMITQHEVRWKAKDLYPKISLIGVLS